MSDLPSFAEFFEAAWGYAPHVWQTNLAEQVIAERQWPDVIDIPTGAGKTACFDIAVYALAAHPTVFARRVAFVVDRRLIVDQTVARAAQLADTLNAAIGTGSVVGAVADQLAGLSFRSPGREPVALDVGRLRGGTTKNGHRQKGSAIGAAEWVRWPDQPAVIVSTVDQFGSRLLFRGYGVGRGMQPIHAGLTGNDCLVLLDEVHISAPLAQTLTDLTTVFSPVRELPRRWQLVQMSATPIGDPPRRFALEPRHVVPGSDLARIVESHKLARLVKVGKPRQTDDEVWRSDAVKLVDQLGVEHGVVGIVVNRVASARAVAEALTPLGSVTLLTGRMRPYERSQAEDRALEWADPRRTPGDNDRTFVVATQCIEVGADLSFDGLITEVSPLSSLKQRFGRLDRRGISSAAGTPAPALIVGLSGSLARDRDPVYGTAMKSMWEALLGRFGDAQFDVGPRSADLTEFPEEVDTRPPDPAVLMPAHLDLLSMTNPPPPASPEVAPFLRGFESGEPDVSIVWRADTSISKDGQQNATQPVDTDRALKTIQAVLPVLPPNPLEMVAVPRSAAIRWLTWPTSSPPAEVADVDQAADDGPEPAADGRSVLRWRTGEQPELIPPNAIGDGDVLVVPSSYGGLVDGAWAPESLTAVTDVAGPTWAQDGRQVVRLTVDLGIDGPMLPTEEQLEELKEKLRTRLVKPTPDDWWSNVQVDRLEDVGPDGHPAWVIADRSTSTVVTFDGSDEVNSVIGAPEPVTLTSHLVGVGTFAEGVAERCFLPTELVADLRLAAELHDIGKADERFQVILHGDEIRALAALEDGQQLAKSVHHRFFRGTYPKGMRHEYASAELISSAPGLLAQAHDRELVMHLVTTHHGHARALPVHVLDPAPRDIKIEVRGHPLSASSTFDSGTVGVESVERFGRLTERYGWHGLAWLETLFRLADHRRSEEESNGTAS